MKLRLKTILLIVGFLFLGLGFSTIIGFIGAGMIGWVIGLMIADDLFGEN